MSCYCIDVGYNRARCRVKRVGIFNFGIGVILMLKCFWSLNPFYWDSGYSDFNIIRKQIQDEITIFCFVFLIFVFLYINYGLIESTYDCNAHKISQWLAINVIFLSLYIVTFTYIIIKHSLYSEIILLSSILATVFPICEMCVVKYFYDKVLENAVWRANAATAVINQCIASNERGIVYGNAVVQNSPTAIPNPVLQTVGRPAGTHYAAQRQHHITIDHPQHLRVPTHSVAGGQCLTQEYCNPPAYSPWADEPR